MEAVSPFLFRKPGRGPVRRGAWEAWTVVIIGVAIVAAGLLFFLIPKETKLVSTASGRGSVVSERRAVQKLEAEAREVLRGFLSARTLAEKEGFLLGSGFFRSAVGFPESFEAGLSEPLFAVSPFYPELQKQGIFALLYERPAELSMESYPKPIFRTEVESGLEQAGWLEMSGNSEYMARAQGQIRVMAFFKREDGKLLLDWDIWKQSGSRALEVFSATPDAPTAKFRVKIGAMHPRVSASFGKTAGKWFWIEDPCYDGLRHAVEAPPEIAQSILARPSMSKPEGSPSLATTVELEWSRETETMRIGKFVCWGFEGLLE